MFYPLSAFIGLRYAKASKGSHFIAFINFFSVAGIALGLMALITVLSVMNGFEGELKLRNLGITPHVLVDNKPEDTLAVDKFTSMQGVVATSQQITSEGIVQSSSGLKGVLFQGIEPQVMQSASVVAQNMLVGELGNLVQGEYGIIIGRALSIKLNLRAGEKARLISSENSYFGPFGRIYSQRVFRVVGIFDMGSALDDKAVFMHIEDAAKLMRSKSSKLAQTRLFLADAFDYKAVVNELEVQGYSSTNWRERQGVLFDAVKMEKNMMWLMLSLIVAVAAFNIVSALVMVVIDKQGEIAILQTFGMDRFGIVKIFISQGVINGVWGVVLGTIAGLLLTLNLNTLLSALGVSVLGTGYSSQALPIDLQYNHVIIIACSALAMSFVATLYPAFRASNTQPAEVLRNE